MINKNKSKKKEIPQLIWSNIVMTNSLNRQLDDQKDLKMMNIQYMRMGNATCAKAQEILGRFWRQELAPTSLVYVTQAGELWKW